MSRRRAFSIHVPAQLEALASMVRQEVLDTVHALGPCSVAEVARALGRPADGLYYHVRTLLEVGLLEDAGTRAAGSSTEALVATPGRGVLRLRYEPGDPENVRAVTKIVGSMMRAAERDFAAGFDVELAVCSGSRRNLNACRQKAWLSDGQVREVNALLGRLQQIFESRSSTRGRLHSMTFVMAPIEASAARR